MKKHGWGVEQHRKVMPHSAIVGYIEPNKLQSLKLTHVSFNLFNYFIIPWDIQKHTSDAFLLNKSLDIPCI